MKKSILTFFVACMLSAFNLATLMQSFFTYLFLGLLPYIMSSSAVGLFVQSGRFDSTKSVFLQPSNRNSVVDSAGGQYSIY